MDSGEMLSGPSVSDGTQVGRSVFRGLSHSVVFAARCTPMSFAVFAMSQSGTFVSIATNAVFTEWAVASRTVSFFLTFDSEFLNEYVPPATRELPQLRKSEKGRVSMDASTTSRRPLPSLR